MDKKREIFKDEIFSYIPGLASGRNIKLKQRIADENGRLINCDFPNALIKVIEINEFYKELGMAYAKAVALNDINKDWIGEIWISEEDIDKNIFNIENSLDFIMGI